MGNYKCIDRSLSGSTPAVVRVKLLQKVSLFAPAVQWLEADLNRPQQLICRTEQAQSGARLAWFRKNTRLIGGRFRPNQMGLSINNVGLQVMLHFVSMYASLLITRNYL